MMGNEQENLLKKYTTCSNTPEITDLVVARHDLAAGDRCIHYHDLVVVLFISVSVTLSRLRLFGCLVELASVAKPASAASASAGANHR
jgi:hypothetical protein